MYDLAMADLQGGDHESFLWDNPPWILSDNTIAVDGVGAVGFGIDEQDKGKKVLDSNTCNTPIQLGGDVAVLEAATTGKKMSGGGSSNNGKASGSGDGDGDGDGDEKGNEGKGGGGVGEADHEIHIWTERERRKKMRNMFTTLHALLPQLSSKADKSTIVDEAVSHIKTLEQTLKKLQKQKLEKLHGMSSMSFVDPSKLNQQKVTMDTRESFLADHGTSSTLATITGANPSPSFSIPRFPVIFQTWTSPNVTLNVCGEDAHISVCSLKKPGLFTAICYALENHKLEVVSAHVSVDNSRGMYMVQAHARLGQFPEAFPIEEVYKQAASEIILWVTS